MVAVGIDVLLDKLTQQPSNWGMHRALIAHIAGDGEKLDHYWLFPQQSILYPGNEIPYLAEAAHAARVYRDDANALDYANRAILLNPDNAKCYAIRGMIRLSLKLPGPTPAEDLATAFEMDPDSLEREPETFAAIEHLIQTALNEGEKDKARSYLKRLGQHKEFGSERIFLDTEAGQRFKQRLGE